MRVVVTGSSGKIGRTAMRALKAAGHRPVGFDLKPSGEEFRSTIVDCTDFGQVMGALAHVDAIGGRPDAVVHLAGIPAPGLAPDQVIFDVNTVSTHNVFTACAELGINRVVWASSETVLGLPYTTPPDFLPIDETHAVRPEYHYSLSKMLGEQMADTFSRWKPGMSFVSLRFSNVYTPADYENIAAVQARPELRRANVWAYIDAEDAGEACRLAVEADIGGHERLIIAAADSVFDIPSADLHSTYLPDVPVPRPLTGYESLLSPARAETVIGFRPQVSWRDK